MGLEAGLFIVSVPTGADPHTSLHLLIRLHGMPHGATDDGVAAMPMGSELHAIVSKIMNAMSR